MQAAALKATRVTGIREASPGAFILSFPRSSDFVPGQCLDITVDPAIPPRAYSISSGAGDPDWEVLFTVVPGGLLTPRLSALNEGDRIFVSAPFGAFRDGEGRSVWIASGTGVAPFASMARSGMTDGKTLIHGSRDPGRLYYRELFESAVAYVSCCTQGDGGAVFHGRLTEYLKGRLPDAERYLLCGSAEMVVEAREILLDRDVPFPKIAAEIYF